MLMEKSKFDINLRVDGRIIPLNEFVKKFTGNMIEGMLKSLKDTEEEWNQVEITISRKK